MIRSVPILPSPARALLRAAALAAILMTGCGLPGDPAPPHRPRNVILVSLDTLRADRLGAYGYERPTSPRFDEFARAAVLFQDCLSASSHTISSHKAMLAGRHPSAWIEAFARAGGPPVPIRSPFEWYARAFQGWVAPSLAGRLSSTGMEAAGFTDGAYMRPLYGFADGFGQYRSRRIGLAGQAEEAIAWLEKNGGSSVFLFVHCYDIHCPYDPPPEDLREFEESCDGRLEFQGTCPETYFNRLDLGPEEIEHVGRHYDAGIRHADRELGRLLDYLRRTGRFEDSVIAVTSDHGEALGDRAGFFGHGKLHQDQLQVPLAIHAPGFGPGVVRAPVSGVDLTPTILDLIYGGAPEGLDGWSLVRLMREAGGSKGPGRRGASAFGSRPRFAANTLNPARPGLTRLRQYAVLSGGMKLIWDAESGVGELYDLRTDPAETRDLLPGDPPEAESLLELLAGRGPETLPGLIRDRADPDPAGQS